MKINEIYFSIQGESSFSGLPCIFIRMSYCNLRCSYCDTKHAYYDGYDCSISEILDRIKKFPCKRVEITGGEPLLQTDINILATQLVETGYTVLCETSGSININKIDSRVHRIVDFKTPDSGEHLKNDWKNIERFVSTDEIKFVICSRKDFEWTKKIIKKYNLTQKNTVLFSPEFKKQSYQKLAEWILEDGLNVRFQIQLHKFVWNPNKTGV